MDPAGPDVGAFVLLAERGRRRPADVPRPRAAAHHARPARAVSSCGRHAVHPRLRERRDAESVRPVQRRVPVCRAALVCPPRRRAAAGDGPLRADRRASGTAPAGPCPRRTEGSELHARAARPAQPRARVVPARRPDQGGDAGRGRGRGLAAARRPESQEACFLAGDDYRAFLGPARAGGAAGRHPRRGRAARRHARRVLAVHARPAARDRRLGGRAALRAHDRCAVEHRHDRPAELARPDAGSARGRLFADADRVEAKLRYGSPAVAASVEQTAPGSGCGSTSRRTASLVARRRFSTTATSSSAPGW